MTKAEQETILRWDEDERIVWVYTACERIMRRYTKLGWEFIPSSRVNGVPTGWTAKGPLNAVKLRRLEGGKTKKRVGHGFAARTPPIA